jgi:hypothetical protein
LRSSTLLACVVVFAFAAGGVSPVSGQDQKQPSAAQQAQRDRMKTCNADAKTKNLIGDARKQFMSDCLNGKTESSAKPLTSQQTKMQTCNKQATDQKLIGDARKQFMSSCLKG